MAYLVYYSKEKEEFKKAFTRELSVETAEMTYKKLCRHFKLREVRLEWTSGRNHPRCSSWRVLLNSSWNNFGVLCHELAHLFSHQKFHSFGHNKKHWKIMKRMIYYCEKKNWFEEELERRTEIKEPKPELTKKEIRLKKIESLELAIKNATKKQEARIKRTQNLIKKNNRKISALKRFI